MRYPVNVIIKIEARNDEALDKQVFVYSKSNPDAKKKFDKLVRTTLIDLACDYLEDEIFDPDGATNEKIIEELTEKLHYVDFYEGEYFSFTHEDGTREIEIDMESYLSK